MKVLTRKKQQDIYKRIVYVVTALAQVQTVDESHDEKINFALGDMWQIARMVGGREMLDAMVGDNYHQRPLRERVGDKISDSMDAADGWIDDLLEEL